MLGIDYCSVTKCIMLMLHMYDVIIMLRIVLHIVLHMHLLSTC